MINKYMINIKIEFETERLKKNENIKLINRDN